MRMKALLRRLLAFWHIRLSLVPTHQLDREAIRGRVTRWRSLGDDPRFMLELKRGGAVCLFRGWYLLKGRFQATEGVIARPCLYPDYGDGMSEVTRIELPKPRADGRLRAVVAFARPVSALRLDPTMTVASFELGDLTLRRLSRVRALVELVRGIHQASSEALRWPQTCAVVRDLLASLVRGRFRTEAVRVVRRYQELVAGDSLNYDRWLSLFEAPVRSCGAPAEDDSSRPLISVLLPVCDPAPDLLRACIDSVLRQRYAHWQLCVADDASTDPKVKDILVEYAARDPRICLDMRARRGHISRATNSALALARGEYVAFLDHDDELAPSALLEVARAIESYPSAKLIYSDEDKIDRAGRRFDPHFKPAWNPELLRSQNYVSHLAVIRTALVRQLGGLRPGFEGAQDHDLLLRCMESLSPQDVIHIPRVLYHWRAIPGSTAMGAGEKPYALEAAQRAVAEHLARTSVRGSVQVTPSGHLSIQRALPGEPPEVLVVIPSRDRGDLLRKCIESIVARTRYPSYSILILDNGSREPDAVAFLKAVQDEGRAKVLHCPEPFNFSGLVNKGVRAGAAPVVCLLNNDIEVITPGWLDEMVAHALRPEVGTVGARLLYPNDTVQHAGVILGIGGVAGHMHARAPRDAHGYMSRGVLAQNLSAVTGACMTFRREVFEKAGGFDERLAVAFNDIDFCLRVRRLGLQVVWTPNAELYHHESASRGTEDTPEKQARFERECRLMRERWGGVLDADPAYNPNLALDTAPFHLAYPPRPRLHRSGVFPSAPSHSPESNHEPAVTAPLAESAPA